MVLAFRHCSNAAHCNYHRQGNFPRKFPPEIPPRKFPPEISWNFSRGFSPEILSENFPRKFPRKFQPGKFPGNVQEFPPEIPPVIFPGYFPRRFPGEISPRKFHPGNSGGTVPTFKDLCLKTGFCEAGPCLDHLFPVPRLICTHESVAAHSTAHRHLSVGGG